MKKRILSLLLALALLCAVLPQITWPAHAEPATSGTCGNNLTWRFDASTGTLTIEGSGKMYDFDWNAQPWYAHMDSIEQIAFPAGLTSIGDWAFGGCTALTTITFPDGLTSIGSCAFYDCAGLTSVTLPAGLTEIDSSAFEGCAGLTSVTLPAGLTSIGSDTFYGCTGLTSVTFPAGLTSIGEQAFYGCTGLTSVALPAGLTSIGGWAFEYCTGLTSITFPDGLTSIGGGAFEYCTGLTLVTFPAGLASIGSWAFAGCTGLTSVIIPASVTEIGWSVFRNVPHESFTIYGYKGTAAQDYANKEGFKFVPLDPSSGFADVKPKHYYYNAMLWALERGITSGTSRVTFSPNDTCTRGQVMTFLYAAKGKPEADWSNNPFVDVKKSKYYFKPVLWAFQNGITNGVDDTHFQPNGGCTRAQVVTFLWALSGKPNPKAGSNPFKDVKKSNWYYKAVLWAYQNGVTSGVDATHFGPNQTCTRGQVVTFLYALLGKK